MAVFKSKIGLVAATVGSAVGLGTVWRFPAETQANGGAAFLLIHIMCALVLGVPVMLSEFAVGRAGRSDAIGDYRKLSPGTRWWLVGAGAILVSYLISCFYMVVGGWTLEYLVGSLNGDLYSGLAQGIPADICTFDAHFTEKMQKYVMGEYSPAVYTMGFIALNIIVLLGGVQKGIERLSNIMMPLLFVLLVILCAVSLSLPGAGEGVRYFLDPDFSKITPHVMISALGQALFSLSLGMGIIVTYAGYYPADTKLTKTSVIVVLMTIGVALLMGLVIFPAVSSFGLGDHGLRGTTLVFVTLPEVFAMLPCSVLWSAIFFILLLMAALTSTVSLAEVTVRMMQDRLRLSRVKAVLLVLGPLFVLSAVCALSFNTLNWLTICGDIIFDFLDNVTNNFMLPVVALMGCIYAGWFAPKGLLSGQLTNYGKLRSPSAPYIIGIIRYLGPAAILAIFISNII